MGKEEVDAEVSFDDLDDDDVEVSGAAPAKGAAAAAPAKGLSKAESKKKPAAAAGSEDELSLGDDDDDGFWDDVPSGDLDDDEEEDAKKAPAAPAAKAAAAPSASGKASGGLLDTAAKQAAVDLAKQGSGELPAPPKDAEQDETPTISRTTSVQRPIGSGASVTAAAKSPAGISRLTQMASQRLDEDDEDDLDLSGDDEPSAPALSDTAKRAGSAAAPAVVVAPPVVAPPPAPAAKVPVSPKAPEPSESADLSKVVDKTKGTALDIPSDQRVQQKPSPFSKPTVVPPAGRVASVAGAMTPMSVTQAAMQASINYRDQATGLELPSPLQLFLQYDSSRNRSVDMREFKQMMFDLDGLKSVDQGKIDEYVEREFHTADLNHDGLISIDEFYYYFYKELCFKFPVLRTGVNPGADLFNIFVKYSSMGKPCKCEEMAGNQWAKLCRDSKLINQRVKRADLDIIFARAKAETEVLEVQQHRPGAEYTTARISYPQFLFALLRLAEKRRTGFQEVVSYIIGNVSAVPVPSMCDLIIFRNTGDESQLAEFLTRPAQLPQLPAMTSEAAARLQREADLAKSLRLPRPKLKSEVIEAAQRSPRLSQDATTLSLALKAGGGDPQVAATTSAGGAADTNKIKTAADEAQAAAKAKADAACKANNAFHNDDAHLLEEVTSYQASPEQRKQWGLEAYGSPESLGLPVTGKAALINPDAMLAVRNLNHDHLMMALKRTFERYNLWEKGVNKSAMDKNKFNKCMRDAGLISEHGPLNGAAADHIFVHVLPISKARANFVEFIEALRHVATCMRLSLNEIMERIVMVHEPLPNV